MPLAEAQDHAEAAGLLLPLSIASEGTATIGGVVATNAGGVSVLHYGTTRQLLLGLEAVLPDGTVVTAADGLADVEAGRPTTRTLDAGVVDDNSDHVRALEAALATLAVGAVG